MAQDNPVLVPVPENDEDGILPPQPNNAYNTELLGPYARLYFVLAGQWYLPLKNIVKARDLPRRPCRIAYAVWQVLVVLIMWSFFFYSMGFFKIPTLQEVDWLCPLTDIKNMVYGLSWIVYQHLGLVFFSFDDLENLLKKLTITKEEVEVKVSLKDGRNKRSPCTSITVFVVGSLLFLFVLPIGLHATQMIIPDFMQMPSFRNRTIKVNNTFPPVQVVLDVTFYTASRFLSLPIFYVLLYMLVFLCSEVEKFKNELANRHYRTEDKARERAIQLKTLMKDAETAFQVFLALYIATLLVSTALEIFSIVEKAEMVISNNHTVYYMSSSVAAGSFQTMDLGSNIMAVPHKMTGKRFIPYVLYIVPPANQTPAGTGTGTRISKIVVDQYRIKTVEIVITAVLDITQNVVLYAFPLYQMSKYKSNLDSVVEMVKDSDSGNQNSNLKIFDHREDKHDFIKYFQETCTSGIRVLGKEVSFLWTLVLTFIGPFIVVVVNLMFKHIHVESPWH